MKIILHNWLISILLFSLVLGSLTLNLNDIIIQILIDSLNIVNFRIIILSAFYSISFTLLNLPHFLSYFIWLSTSLWVFVQMKAPVLILYSSVQHFGVVSIVSPSPSCSRWSNCKHLIIIFLFGLLWMVYTLVVLLFVQILIGLVIIILFNKLRGSHHISKEVVLCNG